MQKYIALVEKLFLRVIERKNFSVNNNSQESEAYLNLQKQIKLYIEKARSSSDTLNLIIEKFSLSSNESLVLAILFDCEVNGRSFNSLNERESLPSIRVLYEILELKVDQEWLFSPESPLIKFGLIEIKSIDSKELYLDQLVKISDRVLRFLNGNYELDQSLICISRLVPPKAIDTTLEGSFDSIELNAQDLLKGPIVLTGSDFHYRYDLMNKISFESNLNILEIDFEAISRSTNPLKVLISVLREAVFSSALIHFKLPREYEDNDLSLIGNYFLREKWPIIITCEKWRSNFNWVYKKISCEISSYQTRFKIWSQLKVENPERLAKRYQISTSRIWSLRDEKFETQNALESFLDRELEIKGFWGASKVNGKHRLENLILHPNFKKQYSSMLENIKNRQYVLEHWGFEQDFSTREGVNILFCGVSGTGKTLSANVLANELGLNMYKVELSSLISKYIGETEKNIDRVFRELVTPGTLVFFDESEALFSKRTEQKSSNDRFSNMEVNFLLQKMEEHQGIVVLATNLEGNIDPAFHRRFDYWLKFNLPAEEERLALWESSFPTLAPMQEIDFKLLAEKMKLSGANIRKIALNAALEAKSQDCHISMEHIVQAAESEHRKMGLFFNNPLD